MFAPSKNNRKMQQVSPTFSSQFYPMIYPMYQPHIYPPFPQNNHPINFSSLSPIKPINSQPKDVPSINDFLEKLDQKYGDGLFTQFLDSFIDESIDVLDVLTLNDSDFSNLGIDKIGIRKKMIREAEKYKDIKY